MILWSHSPPTIHIVCRIIYCSKIEQNRCKIVTNLWKHVKSLFLPQVNIICYKHCCSRFFSYSTSFSFLFLMATLLFSLLWQYIFCFYVFYFVLFIIVLILKFRTMIHIFICINLFTTLNILCLIICVVYEWANFFW